MEPEPFDEEQVREALRLVEEAGPEEVHNVLERLASELGAAVGHTAGASSISVTKVRDGVASTATYPFPALAVSGLQRLSRETVLEEARRAAGQLDLVLAVKILIVELLGLRIIQIMAESHKPSDVTAAVAEALIAVVAILYKGGR